MDYLENLEVFAKQNHVPILRPKSREVLVKTLKSAGAKNILEIGTAIGFSGSLMLLAMPNARLTTIELNQSSIEVANQTFQNLGLSNRTEIIQGDATEIIKNLTQKFDFIFLDGPKTQYVKQLPYLKNLLNTNGVLLADNVLFMGKVLSDEYPKHKHRSCILKLRQFIAEVQNDPSFDSKIIDIEDGLLVAKKIK